MPDRQYIRAPFGVFELRYKRKAILWIDGKREPHDYAKDEILSNVRCYADWREITAAEALDAAIREATP